MVIVFDLVDYIAEMFAEYLRPQIGQNHLNITHF